MLTVDVALPDVEELRALAELGVERGYLTLDEVGAVLEEVELSKEQVEDFHNYLLEHAVELVDSDVRAIDQHPPEFRYEARASSGGFFISELGGQSRARFLEPAAIVR